MNEEICAEISLARAKYEQKERCEASILRMALNYVNIRQLKGNKNGSEKRWTWKRS